MIASSLTYRYLFYLISYFYTHAIYLVVFDFSLPYNYVMNVVNIVLFTNTNTKITICKDHQILFVGESNIRKINPRYPTAAILKNRKKWPHLGNGSTDRHKIWHRDTNSSSDLSRQLQF